jgi:hypothetical protein
MVRMWSAMRSAKVSRGNHRHCRVRRLRRRCRPLGRRRPPLGGRCQPLGRPQSAQSFVHSAHRAQRADSRRLAPTRARRDLVDFFDRVSVRHGVPHNQRVTAPTRVGARARPPEHAREWTRCRRPPRGQGRPAARAPLDRPACALMAGAVARTGASLVAGGTTSATACPRGSPQGPRRSAFHRRRWFEGSVAHRRRQFLRPRRAIR